MACTWTRLHCLYRRGGSPTRWAIPDRNATPPNRAEPHTFYGVYREISPPHRLVYTSNWEPPDRDTGETLVTIEISAKDEFAEIVVTHDLLPDQKSADDHTRGWTGTLESLARHFE